jgi:hypothetical protein
MGGKIKTTKLGKVEHPYELNAYGKKWIVRITELGDLHIEAKDGLLRIRPISDGFIALEQEL